MMPRRKPWLTTKPATPPPEPAAPADQIARSPALTELAAALTDEGYVFAGRDRRRNLLFRHAASERVMVLPGRPWRREWLPGARRIARIIAAGPPEPRP